MNAMPFVYSGDQICQRFASELHHIFAAVRANVEENGTLAKTRDLLLPKLVSGEVALHDAEKTAGEAL